MGAENTAPEVQNSSSVAVMNGLYYVKQITQFVWASISVSKESIIISAPVAHQVGPL